MNHSSPLLLSLLLIALLSIGGCANLSPSPAEAPPESLSQSSPDTPVQSEVLPSPRACAYAAFLQGVQAERNRQYNEARLAYERALTCDPQSSLARDKLPALLFKLGHKEAAIQLLNTTIAENPTDIDSQLFLARLHIHSKNYDEAIDLYRAVIQLEPENETALLSLGYLYTQQKREKEARILFQNVLKRTPDSYFAHLYLARLYSQDKNSKQAAIWYEKAFQLNWSPELAYELIDFYSQVNNTVRTEELYRELNWNNPEDDRAALGLIQTLLLKGGEQKALDELEKLRQTSPNPTSIDLITSRLLLRTNKDEQAAQILEQLLAREESAEARYTLAIIRQHQKKLSQALGHLQQIDQEDARYEDALYLQVRILTESNRRAETLALLKEVTANADSAPPGFFGLLASFYMDQDQLDKARETLDLALVQYPDDPSLHFSLGIVLNKQGRVDDALATMGRVIGLDPDHAEALNYIGYTWADRNINLEQALTYIEHAMELLPDSGYIHDSLGWVYFRLGDINRARTELEQALILTPDDPYIHEHLGDVLHKQLEADEAAEAYRKALELLDDTKAKQKIQDKLNAL